MSGRKYTTSSQAGSYHRCQLQVVKYCTRASNCTPPEGKMVLFRQTLGANFALPTPAGGSPFVWRSRGPCHLGLKWTRWFGSPEDSSEEAGVAGWETFFSSAAS